MPIAVLQGTTVFLFETMTQAIGFMDYWEAEGVVSTLVAVIDRR